MATVKERTIEINVRTTTNEELIITFPYSTETLDQTKAATLSSALSGAISNLTTNTYIDTDIIDTVSLNELAS